MNRQHLDSALKLSMNGPVDATDTNSYTYQVHKGMLTYASFKHSFFSGCTSEESKYLLL